MFYDKYAQICKDRGISMSAAALEAGLSKSLVTKWKVNKVKVPSPDVLEKLSIYFGMPVSELLGEKREEKQKNPATVTGSGMNPDYDELTTENRALVDDLIAKLLKSQSAD